MRAKLNILILDDDYVRHDIWTTLFVKAGHHVRSVYTYPAFKEAVQEQRWDLVFLDHDLCPEAWLEQEGDFVREQIPEFYTGQDAASFLWTLAPDKRPPRVVIHSWNHQGAEEMERILKPVIEHVKRVEFSEVLYMRDERVIREFLKRYLRYNTPAA